MPLRYRFLTKFQKLLIVGTLSWPSSQIHAQVDFAFDQHVHAPGQGSHFGDALALSGQTLAAVDYDAGGSDAYIYLRDGNGWSPQAAIDLPGWNPQPTITPGAHARGRVALAGDILVVGSPGDTIGGQADTGSIRIYRRSVGSWSFQQRIDRPAAASIVGNFGASVAIDGDRMVVGAPGRTAYGRGSVYEYARSGNNWSLAATIESPVEFGRSFGQSLALAGDRLVIGLPHARREASVGDPGSERRIRPKDLALHERRTEDEWNIPAYLRPVVAELRQLQAANIHLLTHSEADGWTVPVSIISNADGEIDPGLFLTAEDGGIRLRRTSAFSLELGNERTLIVVTESEPAQKFVYSGAEGNNDDLTKLLYRSAEDFLKATKTTIT